MVGEYMVWSSIFPREIYQTKIFQSCISWSTWRRDSHVVSAWIEPSLPLIPEATMFEVYSCQQQREKREKSEEKCERL